MFGRLQCDRMMEALVLERRLKDKPYARVKRDTLKPRIPQDTGVLEQPRAFVETLKMTLMKLHQPRHDMHVQYEPVVFQLCPVCDAIPTLRLLVVNAVNKFVPRKISRNRCSNQSNS